MLLLYAERAELPAIRALDAGIRDALTSRGGVEVFAEYLDFARFPAEQHGEALNALLRDRYGAKKLDLVVTAGNSALQFALAHREGLFSGVSITYGGVERHQVENKGLPANVSGVVLAYDFARTIELAMQLQPKARDVVCVFGKGDFDHQVGEQALAALARFPQLHVRRVDDLPLDEIFKQVRHLPPESFVLYVTLMRDAFGKVHFPPGVAQEISAASSVPVYGVSMTYADRGLIGGAMMDYTSHGRAMGAMAVARLNGENLAHQDAASSLLLINWPELKKWKVPAKRVPAEAQIRNRPPSLWNEHPGTLIGIFAAVAIQSTLIAGLLVNHRRRRRAEGALAESMERMSLAAEAANLGLWIWDVSGDDAWMTEQGRALFGLNTDVRLDYATILDKIHPEDRGAREAAIKIALDTHGEYEMEYRVQVPDGEVRWVSARGRCVAGTNGKDSKLLGVSMDVTARKQAELESAQQRVELGHLSRVALVGEMATSLAHELNQPLTAIVTNASAAQRFIARGDMSPDELQELLSDIMADGRRAGEVIRGIKGMVRKVESERRPLDLNEAVVDVLKLVRADALAHGCTLTTALDPALPMVSGDAVQLQQVLLNLIINAFDVMRKTPCEVCRVEITSRQVDTKSVEMSVRDFGPGLPAGASSRIFERFFSTKSEGMGMGLAIARSIIEAHGGTLDAENTDGGGARFWFCLPVHVTATVTLTKEATL